MNCHRLLSGTTLAMVLGGASLVALVWSAGQTASNQPDHLILKDDGIQQIHAGKFTRHYRICVEDDADRAPMRVLHDGRSDVILAGQCRDVTGKRISATSARPLSGDAYIIASYRLIAVS